MLALEMGVENGERKRKRKTNFNQTKKQKTGATGAPVLNKVSEARRAGVRI